VSNVKIAFSCQELEQNWEDTIVQATRTLFIRRVGPSALPALFLVVVLAFGTSTAAQERPNFTGDWTVDLKNSRLDKEYSVLERGLVRIDHSEPTFTFRRTFFVKGQPSEASYVVTTDGREHRGVGPNGAVTVATMHWEQAVLVVHHRIADPKAGQLNNKVRYELIDEGQTLRATEDFDGGGRSHHNVWIFKRR
jgi:hypothetical protein